MRAGVLQILTMRDFDSGSHNSQATNEEVKRFMNEKLKTIKYQQSSQERPRSALADEIEDESQICGICLSPFQNDEVLRVLPCKS